MRSLSTISFVTSTTPVAFIHHLDVLLFSTGKITELLSQSVAMILLCELVKRQGLILTNQQMSRGFVGDGAAMLVLWELNVHVCERYYCIVILISCLSFVHTSISLLHESNFNHYFPCKKNVEIGLL